MADQETAARAGLDGAILSVDENGSDDNLGGAGVRWPATFATADGWVGTTRPTEDPEKFRELASRLCPGIG